MTLNLDELVPGWSEEGFKGTFELVGDVVVVDVTLCVDGELLLRRPEEDLRVTFELDDMNEVEVTLCMDELLVVLWEENFFSTLTELGLEL